MFFVHNPVIGVLLILILALSGALVWHLTHTTHKKSGPSPDTVIRLALTASEVHRHAIRHGSGQVQLPDVVVKTQTNIPGPPPRPAVFYGQLRQNADAREAAEDTLTTELPVLTTEQITADRNALLLRPVVSTAERSLLDMTVAEMMEQIVATSMIPKLDGAPVLPDPSGRRIHASLPDGSEVVRYERAGKWFHEGPGLHTRLTLGQAAILATSPGAVIRQGVPGGGLFDLRVKKAREEQG